LRPRITTTSPGSTASDTSQRICAFPYQASSPATLSIRSPDTDTGPGCASDDEADPDTGPGFAADNEADPDSDADVEGDGDADADAKGEGGADADGDGIEAVGGGALIGDSRFRAKA
jgi:hypothetical protein